MTDQPQYHPRIPDTAPRTWPCRYCAREVIAGQACFCAASQRRVPQPEEGK